jgi:hypothetical protein
MWLLLPVYHQTPERLIRRLSGLAIHLTKTYERIILKGVHPMEPTTQETTYQPPKRKYYPSMTGEERLEALRAIRGMWKGKAAEILKSIEEGREDCELPTKEA